jgi:hypothetical protein
MGVRWFPLVAWAERGGYLADGHGNSVPRFHVTWGTGPGVLAPFVTRARQASDLVGHPELGPDLAQARHQDLARPLVDVVRRSRPAFPGAELPRLRHPGHAGRHPGQRL